MPQTQSQQKPKKQPTKPNSQKPSNLTFLEHVYELRKRLFWVVLVLVVTSAVGLQYKDLLISIVMAPLHGQKLIYLTPGGGFSFIFTLCIYFGALLAIPFAIYHLYRFLQPIMGKSSRRLLVSFMLLSTLLAVGGACFGYFVTIPAALNFLANFAGDAVIPSLTAESYLNFVVMYVLGLAALFQLPLILFLIDHVKPLPPGGLSATQNYVIIGATVLAAIITPTPDAFNMALVAIPIIAIYEIGVMAVYIRHRIKRQPKVVTQQPLTEVDIVQREPLTAYLEEQEAEEAFNQNEVLSTAEEQRRVELPAATVHQMPFGTGSPRGLSAPVSVPVPAPVQVNGRVVDGVVRRLATPERVIGRSEAAAARFAAQQRTLQRPIRSIEGFLPS
jgi:sec-independent protein translocase protein TatC